MSEIAKEVGLPEPLELTDAEISAARAGPKVEIYPPTPCPKRDSRRLPRPGTLDPLARVVSAIRAQTSCFSSGVSALRLAMPEQPTAGGSGRANKGTKRGPDLSLFPR
jgi:hypothetical protein